ncbi:hypothetical protein HUN73_10305 [Staphylococcus sp. 58-52]|nr:hypothetical protein [Staphylococcus borealis]
MLHFLVGDALYLIFSNYDNSSFYKKG